MVNQPKKFTRRIEDFDCEKCGAKNIGTGFTNHCCKCLWSKHVDINPGDRAANCGGMMEPVKIDFEKNKYIINHKCVKCGFQKRQSLEKNDNFDAAVAVTKKLAK
ncbi:MAG: RNHCP domain-containing protein [Candidatus Paceibacterota bacterium]|jgi:Zn ribbon nucleic-acid-binding protein